MGLSRGNRGGGGRVGEGSRGRGDSQRTNYCIPTEAEIGRERETGALFE